MTRNHCVRSFVISSILVSVIIVSQLFFLEETTSDTESLWRDSDLIVTDPGDERDWNRRRAIDSFSLVCPNCTFVNGSGFNRTMTNDSSATIRNERFYSYLRDYVHRLNLAPVVRNLDKFDLPSDGGGSLVIVVQVHSCSFGASLILMLLQKPSEPET